MQVEFPTRLVLVARDENGEILDYFLGPYAHMPFQEALAIAHVILTARRARLARVEVHPLSHARSLYSEKPLAVLSRDDLTDPDA